jgi:hypothetical protein
MTKDPHLLVLTVSVHTHRLPLAKSVCDMHLNSSASDNEKFQVDKEVAERSMLIKNMIEGEFTKLDHQSPQFPYMFEMYAL